MQLRLPGGSSFLDGLFDTSPTMGPNTSNSLTDAARPEQVSAALDALAAGHVEYVGLDDETSGLQVGDVGGGHLLQRTLDGENWVDQPASLTIDELKSAFHAFLGGDVTAGLSWPAAEERSRKKGWFRRG